MDAAVRKRLETLKRRKEAEALLGSPGVKKLPATSSTKTLTGFMLSEKLARLLDDRGTSAVSSPPGPATQESPCRRSPATSDVEMLNGRSQHSESSPLTDSPTADQAILGLQDGPENGVGIHAVSPSIPKATPDGSYTKWRGMLLVRGAQFFGLPSDRPTQLRTVTLPQVLRRAQSRKT